MLQRSTNSADTIPAATNSRSLFEFFSLKPSSRLTVLPIVILLFMFAQMLFSCVATRQVQASASSDGAIFRTWQRPDQPIKEGKVARTWVWGPQPNQSGYEPYMQAPGGMRQVVYYDKSRMEVNQPDADATSKWYVTNGLLVREMISGMIQTGDNQFLAYKPAEQVLAGDPISINSNAPTYLSLKSLASLDNDNRSINRTGEIIKERLYKAGVFDVDSNLAAYNVSYAHYEPTLGHNIPNVFMRFFNERGMVIENNRPATDVIFDWLYAAGLPLTEPYWAKVKVDGVVKDVLVQAFERRIITYTPSNDAQWRLELGNVGQHYYAWRYPAESSKDVANPDGPGLNPGGPTSGGAGGNVTPGATPTSSTGNATATPTSSTGNATATPTSSTGSDSCTATGTNQKPDISLSVGNGSLPLGGTSIIPMVLNSLNGFEGIVSLSVDGQIPGLSVNISTPTITLNANGNLTANVELGTTDIKLLQPGTHKLGLTAKACAGAILRSVPLSINVAALLQGTATPGATATPSVTVPVPTVTVPAVPTVTVPAVPTVTVPAVPTVTVPAVPTATVPAVPTVTVPAVPTVTVPAVPTVTVPAVPTVTVPVPTITINLP